MGRLLVVTALICSVAAAAEEAPPAPPPPPKSPKVTKELLEKGKQVYATTCLSCHGEKGDGNGPAGVALVPKPRDFNKDPFKQGSRPEDVFLTITNGVPTTAMIPWAHLSEEDRWALTHYVLQWVPKANRNKKPPPVTAPGTP